MQSSSRLLWAINLSIAVLLVAALAGGYWYAVRPLPQTSGEIKAPISARGTIARDAIGVPHITAATWEDALFLQGYALAQDRLFQLDAMRRLANGDLAEVIGPRTVQSDREARQLRMPRLAEFLEARLTPDARAAFAAYARGVNYFIETHRDRLPVEFTLLNYHPRPWNSRDTVLIILHMYRTLTTSWRGEISKLHMQNNGDPMKVAFLYPERLGTESAPGSNAWAVSGEHTASGKAMLASDPHMEFSLPSPWYLVHLTAPGLNVTGASLAGVPAVVIGHNDRIAWGVTNLEFDMQDLYSERVDAQSGTYVYQGRIQAARLEREAIPVKGAAPVDLLTMSTRHGPLILNDDNQTYSLRWMPGELTGMDFPLLALNRAGNWEEFNNALRRFSGPAQNFIYADVDGNIGHHVAGPVPLRGTCSGDVPNDGPSGTCEWNGTIPYDDLPQVYNPPSGIIVSANQNPFPANYKHPVSGVFAPPYRARQIRARLKAKEKLAIPDMLSIQKDVYSSPLNFISKQMDWAWKARAASNLPSREAVAFLRAWDGQMESGPAPVIAALLYEEVRKSAAKSAAPDAAAEYGSRMAPSVIERLLKERPNDWFKEGYDDMMVNALASAISRGTELFGSSISRWDWGRFSRAELRHGVLGGLPLLGRYVNIGPAPMSGSAHSVKQITDRLAPSFRMVVDFADFDASVANVTTGQSGQVFSPHYKDQWPAYYNGTGLPMQFQKVTAIETLVVAP